MSEFAYSPTGHNSYLGPAHNPWDVSRITGGSSSGSGAAVAARLTHAALGSDTGGSIRLPAHFCGVTGFKPTNGRVSRANALPLSFTLDSVGPLAQTAEDCALINSIIFGPDPLDPTTAGAPAWNAKTARRSPKGLKIGVPTKFYVDDLEPDVAAALDAALAAFTRLGAKIVKVELPDQTALSAAALIVLAVEATSAHAPWLRTRAADYGPQVRNRLENGLAYSAIEYLEALRWRAPGAGGASRRARRRRRRHRAGIAAGRPHHRGDRCRRRAGRRGGDPGGHPLHAAGELSRPADAGGPGRAVAPGAADRAATDRASVRRRDADRARHRVPERDRSSPPDAGAAMSRGAGSMDMRRSLQSSEERNDVHTPWFSRRLRRRIAERHNRFARAGDSQDDRA